jgi:hypothetical protein
MDSTHARARTRRLRARAAVAFAAALATTLAAAADNKLSDAKDNIGIGNGALKKVTGGLGNIGIGGRVLEYNSGGSDNTAIGTSALPFVQGDYNIALGYQAGFFLQRGSNNILIGNIGNPYGSGGIYIGMPATHTKTFIAGINGITTGQPGVPVLVDANGQLGTVSSSRTVKEDIADMGDTSALLMKLRPVTFRYRERPAWPLQYGLVAEEVAQVAPGLAARSPDGSVQTVYYQFLAPMLLNEYQKQQRVIEAQQARLEAVERELARLEAKLGGN